MSAFYDATVEMDGQIYFGTYSELTWDRAGLRNQYDDDARMLSVLDGEATIFVELRDWQKVQSNLSRCPYPSRQTMQPRFDMGDAA